MNIKTLLLIPITFLLITSCNEPPTAQTEHKHDHGHKHEGHKHEHGHKHAHGDANKHMHETSFEELVKRFEGSERDKYQKPNEVIKFLGNVEGKTIIDIGAGTGYFSFPLAQAGARVIAADVDERFLAYIKKKKEKLGMTDKQVIPKKVPYDTPNLKNGEADMAIIVNTYHHIEDRKIYFNKVKNGLKKGGELVVIDFFKKETPMGPPVELKLAEDQVISELKTSGFNEFDINVKLLPYQYIIRAK